MFIPIDRNDDDISRHQFFRFDVFKDAPTAAHLNDFAVTHSVAQFSLILNNLM